MPSVATIKKVRSLHQKKFRQKEGLFLVEGQKMVEELLRSDFVVDQLFSTVDFAGSENVSEGELERMSSLRNANQVLAVVKIPNIKLNPDKPSLVLDGVNDPGNLGTIIRIADWYGIDQVVCSKNTVDCYNPKVVQSTMGSLFRTSVHYLDLEEFLAKTTIPTFGAVMDGNTPERAGMAVNLVLGSESHGIRESILPYLNQRVTIPRIGEAESLNVAVAAGILLDRLCGK